MKKMEQMKLAEELVREFLVYRGFTNTLQSFEKELATDIGKSFHVDKILDLIFSIYIPKFEAHKLVDLITFFKNCFSYSDPTLSSVITKLEQSILRYYVVNASRCGRKDMVLEFFNVFGSDLMRGDESWTSWFVIPYLQNPHMEAQFRVYFTDDWFRSLQLSVRNFLSEVLNGTRTPALLKISSEKNTVSHLRNEIVKLSLELSRVRALLDKKEAQLCLSRSDAEEAKPPLKMLKDTYVASTSQMEEAVTMQMRAGDQIEESHVPSAEFSDPANDRCQVSDDAVIGNCSDMQREENFPEVRAVFQVIMDARQYVQSFFIKDTFLGHTSPISCSRFSASGDNIASASTDGTVRIWTYDSSASTSRNATIYCGAEIMSLEWDCKYDRLLLMGTSDGGIKAWNVDAKRVVCDLNSAELYPGILDLKCSPVEPVFVSAAASTRSGSSYFEKLGLASLTVWNMRTWKPMAALPLGKDPPAVTSLSFNHNGKLLAAAATDGMIHMFDMAAGQQVTGWPAHDSAISSIRFGPDETSIFSLGVDGNIFEWSLHNQGKILWSRNCSRFCNPDNSLQHTRHEMTLDADGRRLLVTSNTQRAPIYQVRGQISGMRTLPHNKSITTVDWHPTSAIFLTGSSDHSVRVTSIL